MSQPIIPMLYLTTPAAKEAAARALHAEGALIGSPNRTVEYAIGQAQHRDVEGVRLNASDPRVAYFVARHYLDCRLTNPRFTLTNSLSHMLSVIRRQKLIPPRAV